MSKIATNTSAAEGAAAAPKAKREREPVAPSIKPVFAVVGADGTLVHKMADGTGTAGWLVDHDRAHLDSYLDAMTYAEAKSLRIVELVEKGRRGPRGPNKKKTTGAT